MLPREIRLAVLSFVFTNLDLVPDGIKKRKASKEGIFYTPERIEGSLFIPETDSVGCLGLVDDFKDVGYTLVDAWWEEKSKDRRPYYQVRFTYAAPGCDESSPEFRETIEVVSEALQTLLFESMWQVRGFVNPFFADGELVKGASALSINFGAREPLFDKNGQPQKQWQRDEDGKRIGERSVAIQPTKFLRIVDEDIRIVPAEEFAQ